MIVICTKRLFDAVAGKGSCFYLWTLFVLSLFIIGLLIIEDSIDA